MCPTPEQKIIAKAKTIGIDKIGFGTAAPFEELLEGLYEQKKNNHTSGFEHPIIEERIYPQLVYDHPKSFISVALAYPTQMKEIPLREKGKRRGSFARVSWGVDYHVLLREKLDVLVAFLKEEFGTDYYFEPMVDTGVFIDTAVAQRCGLGFIGKNGLLITKEFGSYVYLGEIITDLKLEPNAIIENGCGECNRCIDSCPTGALLGDGRMNAKRCLSYQTQVRDYIPEEFRKKMGHVIYGCDICQMCCPYNRGIDFHLHEQMEPDPEEAMPLLQPLLKVSNREFSQQYGHLSGSWRGKKPIQRNAIIALANSRDKSSVPLLLELIENDPRPVIRGTCAWAVSQIMQKDANEQLLTYLEAAYCKEVDKQTRNEFQKAINLLKKEGPL
ncbi:tRNA epoxyqueuosine(34) reductase QueG [Allofustis seminis]|uniref:tRNA epoxyqueuosine(34) reductase QueG n=1 Tax=Allofustis seminis TaxID=166939 RepID=UPI0003721E28|nr:tRNA epoxyqueuosine(34) reductase QueG [Allofustis seminis]